MLPVLVILRPGRMALSVAEESLFLYATLRPPEGSGPPPPVSVVTLSAVEAAETFPAASRARTV